MLPLLLLGGNASQEAAAPPDEQVHIQGPLPVVAEAVPTLQRPLVGAELVVEPLARPHCPVATGAKQEAVEPPDPPAHVQFHGPVPPTAEAVPALHRLALGGLVTGTPIAEPQTPVTVGLPVGCSVV
jgi:hypothetical protein